MKELVILALLASGCSGVRGFAVAASTRTDGGTILYGAQDCQLGHGDKKCYGTDYKVDAWAARAQAIKDGSALAESLIKSACGARSWAVDEEALSGYSKLAPSLPNRDTMVLIYTCK